MQYERKIVTFHSRADIVPALDQLLEEGYRTVVCDVAAHGIAMQKGMNAFLLNSGEESIREALAQANALGRMNRAMRDENTMLHTALENEQILTAVMDRNGRLLRAYPREVPPETEQVLKDHISDALRGGTTQFFHTYGGTLYSVAAKLINDDDEQIVSFSWRTSSVPQRIRPGIQNLSLAECEHQFTRSFYALSGAMGEMEGRVNAVAVSK